MQTAQKRMSVAAFPQNFVDKNSLRATAPAFPERKVPLLPSGTKVHLGASIWEAAGALSLSLISALAGGS